MHQPVISGLRDGERKRVAVILDSPNILRTVQSTYGPLVKPDYAALLQVAREHGKLTGAIAAVNNGIPAFFVRQFRLIGYGVQFSNAKDCDDRCVALAVRLHSRADVLILASGDGAFCEISRIWRQSAKMVIVVAVQDYCNRSLIAAANLFIPVPIVFNGVPNSGEGLRSRDHR